MAARFEGGRYSGCKHVKRVERRTQKLMMDTQTLWFSSSSRFAIGTVGHTQRNYCKRRVVIPETSAGYPLSSHNPVWRSLRRAFADAILRALYSGACRPAKFYTQPVLDPYPDPGGLLSFRFKRIADREPLDLLPVLHVLRVQNATAAL